MTPDTDPTLYNFEDEECYDDEPRLWVSWWWVIATAVVVGIAIGIFASGLFL